MQTRLEEGAYFTIGKNYLTLSFELFHIHICLSYQNSFLNIFFSNKCVDIESLPVREKFLIEKVFNIFYYLKIL